MYKNAFKSVSLDHEKKINLEDGVIPFILTSKTVDRDSEVILPDGGDVEEFKQNPVFLWAHDMWSPSIGKVLPDSIKVNKQRMTADVEFDMDDPFAALIFNKYAKGYLNAGSIRFSPLEIGKEPVLPGQKRDTIKRWKLLEFSAVPVPANPQALSQIQKGIEDIDDPRAKAWIKAIDRLTDTIEEELSFTDAYIKAMNEPFEDPEIDDDSNVLDSVKDEISIKDTIREAVWEATGRKDVPFEKHEPVQDLPTEFDNISDVRLFGYHDPVKDSYKFQHHNINDGKIITPWPLLAQAMVDLFKDTDITEEERKHVYEHLVRHYKEFDIKPPEYNTEQPESEMIDEDDGQISDEDLEKIINFTTELLKTKK